MVLKGTAGDSRAKLPRVRKKKGKNPPRGLFHYFQQIKQAKEKGQVKTVVFLKTCPTTDTFSGTSHIITPFL